MQLKMLLASASVAFAGCAVQPYANVSPATIGYEPRPPFPTYGSATPDPRTNTTRAWDNGGSLGPCNSTETLQYNQRIGFTQTCGYANPNATALPNGWEAQKLPQFMSVRTIDINNQYDEQQGTICSGRLIMVRPDSGTSQAKLIPAGTILHEWDNLAIPRGWAVPAQAIRDQNGVIVSSTMGCYQPLATHVPVLQ